ncbi:uncharacterized protein LOC141601767 [Silene latifolia]|uniref:uncharacterized protein LOC141601767 n=1 Tax=Silene latifolia TaxID=37657 RepID=UPI003D77352D
MWSGKSADYSILMAFGSTAYYHVSEGKLEPRAKKGVFMGYGDGVKGYRIWSPSEGRVILSRNVVFDENSMVNPTVKTYMLSDSSCSVDKQVEQQDTHDESVPQEEDQPLPSESESESIPSDSSLPVPNQQSLARERSIRPNFGKPPNRLGFEDMVGYALQSSFKRWILTYMSHPLSKKQLHVLNLPNGLLP